VHATYVSRKRSSLCALATIHLCVPQLLSFVHVVMFYRWTVVLCARTGTYRPSKKLRQVPLLFHL
jgi:hypothetical protein